VQAGIGVRRRVTLLPVNKPGPLVRGWEPNPQAFGSLFPAITDNHPEAPTPRKKVSKPRFNGGDAGCHREGHSEINLLSVVYVVRDQRQEWIKTACRQT
jgi:hypothetical protein